MNKRAPTPGPWRYSPQYRYILSMAQGVDENIVCDVNGSQNGACLPEPHDAYLIAAAPELLEALERIKESGVFVGAIAQDMMDAAIAKARGAE